MRTVSSLVLVLSMMLLSSCATVFSSKQQNVSFDSNERGVEVYINGKMVCTTPCVAKVDRSRDTLLIVGKKAGFEDAAMTVTSGVNVITLINVISFTTGSFGLTTDMTNNHAWEYQPNAFYFTMEKADNSPQGVARRIKENKIREYILSNYADIKADVVYTGKKEYLIALSKMTGLSMDRLNALASQSENEADFTNVVVKEYRKRN